MKNFEKFCQDNGIDTSKAFNMIIGNGGSVLPGRGFTGYFCEITDDSIICTNEKLEVKKEIPFSSFKEAEFGIGNGTLWLQCIVGSSQFVFNLSRKGWKSPTGKLLMDKISEHTELKDMKAYEQYTGKLFFIYMWK